MGVAALMASLLVQSNAITWKRFTFYLVKIVIEFIGDNVINSSALGQNGHHFTYDILECIFMTQKFCISFQISISIQLTISQHWFRHWLVKAIVLAIIKIRRFHICLIFVIESPYPEEYLYIETGPCCVLWINLVMSLDSTDWVIPYTSQCLPFPNGCGGNYHHTR